MNYYNKSFGPLPPHPFHNGVKINVEVIFEPPWEPKMMTVEGRKKMGFEPSDKKNENKEWE